MIPLTHQHAHVASSMTADIPSYWWKETQLRRAPKSNYGSCALPLKLWPSLSAGSVYLPANAGAGMKSSKLPPISGSRSRDFISSAGDLDQL